MHCLFDVALVNDRFGDPALYVDFRDERRALLFDLGDVSSLPPRRLLRLSHVFVTHAHMDHFSGFDHLLRIVLGRKLGLVLYGGPGFVDQVGAKLAAYTWNVVDRYEVPLAIEVREVGMDGTGRSAVFSSRRRFVREDAVPFAPVDDTLHDEAAFRVRGRFVDHGTPCLALLLEEKVRVRIDKDRLLASGFGTGAWLRELKHAVLSGLPDETPIEVKWRDAAGAHARTCSVGELRPLILDTVAGARVGYATDLAWTQANVEVLAQLMSGVDRLCIESVFLDADAAHGERKFHLTARQAGEIAARLDAKAVVPFHFSPRYEGRADEILREVEAAWTAGRRAAERATSRP